MVRARDETRSRLRWQAVDAAPPEGAGVDGEEGPVSGPVGVSGSVPQPALFAAPGERIRHPEFADLEFIHVRAKRIINEVPAASRVPFRFTINAYRGCSHACSYCASGDTPILMGDGRTKPLAEVQVGDPVYGTVREGRYRRYVVTEVLDHWSTVKPAYRVTLEDGTELVSSGDHRFLTDRGWKHVTGSEHGRLRRPHLTLNNKLIGTGGVASGPDHGPEYRRGYLCGLIRGDGHLSTYSYTTLWRHEARHHFRLALTDLEALRRAKLYLADVGVGTKEFLFQKAVGARKTVYAIRNGAAAGVSAIRDIVCWPERPSASWCKGFLAGIFDAEGSYSRWILRIGNTDPAILDRIGFCLRRFGFPIVVERRDRENGMTYIRVRGGVREHLRFFHTVNPAITRKRSVEGMALKTDAPLRVVSIEPLGRELPLFDITTGTGDFIANGVVSHNCFARPTHEYLNLDAGRDFERVIVVKVNAVEALRGELNPRRWDGEHIAMGTNTDPYQRCEGRYRLTRGVLETLTEARNPFSILTKSPLVLRDLDLLAEAQRVTRVGINFSIGTLDRDVWRASEPGTPHPEKRVEAIATLREAGIHAGVLVAPVIPGISDAPEQLEAVVKACVDAGARSISPIVLHLRPGVKEQFLPWLEEHRPDLLERYRRLYPRSYAPKAEQQRIARLVEELVARFRGATASPRAARGLPESASPPAAPAPPASSTASGAGASSASQRRRGKPRGDDEQPLASQLTLGF